VGQYENGFLFDFRSRALVERPVPTIQAGFIDKLSRGGW